MRQIRKAVFDETDPTLGLKMISLVSDPAIQVHWIKFSKDLNEKEIRLAVQDEGLMQFITPVLIPNQLIPRKIDNEEFDLVFDAETIRLIAYDWQKKNLSNAVDKQHSRQLISGVHFCETFLTSDKTVQSVKGFEMLPAGTWFVVGRADNAQAWEPIKNGEVKGVSIDGFFKTADVKMNNFKLTEVKVANDNSLFVDGDIAPGSYVFYNRPEIKLVNGARTEIKHLVWESNITLEDGTVLSITDGKITEVNKGSISDQTVMSIAKILYTPGTN